MESKKKVEVEATMKPSNNSLKKLCEQYDQEMADIEVDLDIHDKLLKLMRENLATKQQQLSSVQKNTEQTEKELRLLDEKTNELVQSTNLQGEKIEEFKRVQQQVIDGINHAQHCLLTAENTARDDLEKFHSMEREAQKFLECNLTSPNFSCVALKLQNYQKKFCSKVQESIDRLTLVKSVADEADHLKNLEKVLEEMRLDTADLEGQIGEIDAKCSFCHDKIFKLNMEQEEEKRRRSAISEKYKQRKKRIAELTRTLNSRKSDKKLLSENLNSKEQELNKIEECFARKNADAAAIQREVDAIKDKLAELEDIMKFEHEKHEQKVQEIKESGEANIRATESILMALREKQSAKLMQIQQARDDLNKKSEWETHKKINEEMERNLEQLKQEKVQLELALDEADRRRNAQLYEMKAMKSAFQESKLEASKKREFLMKEMKRMSEQILILKHKIGEEERRLKAQRNAVDRQLKIVTVNKDVGMLIRCAFEKDEKSRQSGAETTHELLKKGLTSQGGADQKLQGTEFDMVEKSEKSVTDVKAEKPGDEEMVVRENDPRKLLPKKKSAEDEKVNSTFVVSHIKKPFLFDKRSEGRGEIQIPSAKEEESKLAQPTTKYKTSRYDLVQKNLSLSNTQSIVSGPSKTGRQIRKKREQGEEKTAHDLALTLFDSDVSASTIKPMYASTPLLQKKNESSFYNDAAKGTPKKRGRPKGKKAATETLAVNDNLKLAKKKDAYDLDSNFD